MQAEVEVLVLPYDSVEGDSLLDRLIDELQEGGWKDFKGAVAFGRASGNFPDLISALDSFTEAEDRSVSLTFGADIFGRSGRGSDYHAVETILEAFDKRTNFRLHLYHERGRTFHPKIYLFSNEPDGRAMVIIGSSNWSEGGLVQNVEANVLIHFDLSRDDQIASYDRLISYFDRFWSEVDGGR